MARGRSSTRSIDRLTDRSAVLSALAEYDRMGRSEFNVLYGFRGSRKYRLLHNGRTYDAKSVLLAAFGYQFPAEGPLANEEVASNRREVRDPLVSLGFIVTEDGA
jgi:hypothetical protein